MGPAGLLEGLVLEGKWTVVKRLVPKPTGTCGHFSTGYIVEDKAGRKAFVMAMDYARAMQCSNLRIAVATQVALEREFGWIIRRVPHPDGDSWWESANKPQRYPKGLEGCIAEMGLSHPHRGASPGGGFFVDRGRGRADDEPAPTWHRAGSSGGQGEN
jgi:hypothetical protein